MDEKAAAERVYQDWIQQVQYFEKVLENLDDGTKNVEMLREQINALESLNGDEEVLAPIANGIFLKANLRDAKTLKVNVGKGIMVDRTISETLALIEKQEKEINSTRDQVLHKLEELYEMAKEY